MRPKGLSARIPSSEARASAASSRATGAGRGSPLSPAKRPGSGPGGEADGGRRERRDGPDEPRGRDPPHGSAPAATKPT